MGIIKGQNELRIGTRGSPLALAQTQLVIDALIHADSSLINKISVIPILTTGDKTKHRPLNEIGGKSLFTKEIEESLLQKQIDLAVHSMKDLPSDLPDGLMIGAMLQREDPRDVFISRDQTEINNLPSGSRIGTSSLRRQSQLLNLYPSLHIVPLRGNIESRIRKVTRSDLDGIVIAYAGVKRLGLEQTITQIFETSQVLPAVAQGAIGIECRMDDEKMIRLLKRINHFDTSICVTAERVFMKALDGSCQTPIAAYAQTVEQELILEGFLGDVNGQKIIRAHRASPLEQAEQLGLELAQDVKQRFSS